MAYEGPQIKLSGVKAASDLRTKQFYFVKVSADATIDACSLAADIPIGVLQNTPNTGQAADVVVIGETKVAIEGTSASVLITDSNTIDVTTGATVTVGSTVYTYSSAVLLNYQVLVAGGADSSLLNLARAINNSGGVANTDYKVPTAHPTVSASSVVTAHHILLSARTAGTGGNSIAVSATDSTQIVATPTLLGGLGAAAGNAIGTGASGRVDLKTPGTDTTEYVVGQVAESAANIGELATAIIDCATPHRAA